MIREKNVSSWVQNVVKLLLFEKENVNYERPFYCCCVFSLLADFSAHKVSLLSG